MDHVPDRSARPDDLRILSTIGVVLIHASAPAIQEFGLLSPVNWGIACGFGSVARPAVPLFFMLSGMLLIPKVHEPWSFLRRRVSRVLLPFLVWSMIYVWVQPSGDERSAPVRFLTSLVEGASYHLWFVHVLLAAYLALPIIGPWARSAGRTGLQYFLVIWGLAQVLGTWNVDHWFVRSEAGLFMGHLGYLVLGYYLSILPVDQLRWRRIGWSLFVTGTILTLAGTAWSSYRLGAFQDHLFSYTSPNVVIAAAGLMMLLRAEALPSFDRWPTARQVMAECSYGVYLVHILVLGGLDHVGLTWRTIHPLIGVPMITLVCFLLSVLVVRAVRALPFGDKLVG